MSKSKKNVIDPGLIIDTYGADTARWFMLSDSPPERDLEWTEAGVGGAWRFTQRLWALLQARLPALPARGAKLPAGAMPPQVEALRTLTHQAIRDITQDLEAFRFNKAVARIHELANAIEDVKDFADPAAAWASREALEALVQLAAPMLPHLAEEMWQALGGDGLVLDQPWPEFDAALATDRLVTIAVQVSGKLRATLEVARDLPDAELERLALAHEKIQAALAGKAPRKIVVVPNRIVNVVA